LKSLKTKVIVILLSVFILYGAINYGIIHFIIFPSFLALKNDEARKDVERSVQAIKSEIYHLDLLCYDWAAWPEALKDIPKQLTPESPYVITKNDNEFLQIYVTVSDVEGDGVRSSAQCSQFVNPCGRPDRTFA